MIIFRFRGCHVNLFVQMNVDPYCTPSTEEIQPRREPAAHTLQAAGNVTFSGRRGGHSLPLLMLEC